MTDFWDTCKKAQKEMQKWPEWKKLQGLVTLEKTPRKTRLVEPVPTGLDADDQEA